MREICNITITKAVAPSQNISLIGQQILRYLFYCLDIGAVVLRENTTRIMTLLKHFIAIVQFASSFHYNNYRKMYHRRQIKLKSAAQ